MLLLSRITALPCFLCSSTPPLHRSLLQAKPNLESRIKTLKRDWAIVYDMLTEKDNSGFGWDEHRQMIVAEDAVWNSYISSHKSAFRHRSFPHYDQFTSIYTKDRATGKDAQTIADINEEIDVEDVATVKNLEERNITMDAKMMFP